MKWEQIEGDWKEFKGKVKEKWRKLTEEELETILGKKDSPEEEIAVNQPHSGGEGEAPAALPMEGATRAPDEKHLKDF